MTTMTLGQPATVDKGAGKDAKVAVPAVAFTRAAREYVEPTELDVSRVLTGNTQIVGPFSVPAAGFVRSLILMVEATGGVGGGATVAAKEDAPWSVISELSLASPNGDDLIDALPGHMLYLLHKYGGYAFQSDPTLSPFFSAPAVGAGATGNFAFLLRVPVEITNRDGLGALSNQNAAQPYQVTIRLAPSTDVYSTAPATTLPTVRLRCVLEAWTQPNPTDLRGRVQMTAPPAHGTRQEWSQVEKRVELGAATVQLTRTGNLIRNVVLINRDAGTGLRSAANLPDNLVLSWDGRSLFDIPTALVRHYMAERYGYTGAALDTGVLVFDFTHDFDGHPGGEMRDLYLPTTQGSRVEIKGSWKAASVVRLLTNDVAPAAEIYA